MTSQSRLAEAAFGAVAVSLPLSQSLRALPLTVVGLVTLVVVVVRSSPGARTLVACSVVGNAFVFAHSRSFVISTVASALTWVDAVLLLAFLAIGGSVEAGARRLAETAAIGGGGVGLRVCFGAVAITIVALAAQIAVAPDAWLVFAAMLAGIAALAIAVRQAR